MRKFRKEDYIGTTLERFVLWAISALLTVLMGYIYYEVSYEDGFVMLLMVAAAAIHVIVDVICYIAKQIKKYDDYKELE